MKKAVPRCKYFIIATVFVSCLSLPPAGRAARADDLDSDPQTDAAGNYHALVIGINAYQNIQRLKTAEDDAKEVVAILREQYGFQTKLLLNANRQQIISAINAYRRELTPDSNLLIYYAGHGINDKEIDKAYWLPVDARLDDNSNWISADDITSNIKGIPAKHVLIVSDSCYSGTLTRGLEASLPAPSERQRYLQKMMSGKSRTLMASGGNEPVADGGGGSHSIFANALLRGLAQMERSQFTANELFRDFVEESVAGRASQTPEYNPLRNSGHESGDFIFNRAGAGKKMKETAASDAPASSSTATRTSVDPAAVELSFWDSIKHSSDPLDFKAYLDKYPNGVFADLARRRAAVASPGKPTNDAPPANAPNVAPRGRVIPAKLRSVRDYFLSIPEQYLRLPDARRAEILRSPATIVDLKNGYISFQIGKYERHALTVFKLSAESYLVAVSNTGPPTATMGVSDLVFLRFEGEEWRDVTQATLPVPFDPKLVYELPRFGTTINVMNQSGGKVYELVWTNASFTLKRARVEP